MVKHHEHIEPRRKPKWWQWMALALMLLAIGTYVFTLDDSVVPEVETSNSSQPGPGR